MTLLNSKRRVSDNIKELLYGSDEDILLAIQLLLNECEGNVEAVKDALTYIPKISIQARKGQDFKPWMSQRDKYSNLIIGYHICKESKIIGYIPFGTTHIIDHW